VKTQTTNNNKKVKKSEKLKNEKKKKKKKKKAKQNEMKRANTKRRTDARRWSSTSHTWGGCGAGASETPAVEGLRFSFFRCFISLSKSRTSNDPSYQLTI
jgi:hypothetical protein